MARLLRRLQRALHATPARSLQGRAPLLQTPMLAAHRLPWRMLCGGGLRINGASLLSDVLVVGVGQRDGGGLVQLLLVLLLLLEVDDHLRGRQRHLLHEVQLRVPAGQQTTALVSSDSVQSNSLQRVLSTSPDSGSEPHSCEEEVAKRSGGTAQ